MCSKPCNRVIARSAPQEVLATAQVAEQLEGEEDVIVLEIELMH